MTETLLKRTKNRKLSIHLFDISFCSKPWYLDLRFSFPRERDRERTKIWHFRSITFTVIKLFLGPSWKGWLVVLCLTALWDNISAYSGALTINLAGRPALEVYQTLSGAPPGYPPPPVEEVFVIFLSLLCRPHSREKGYWSRTESIHAFHILPWTWTPSEKVHLHIKRQ